MHNNGSISGYHPRLSPESAQGGLPTSPSAQSLRSSAGGAVTQCRFLDVESAQVLKHRLARRGYMDLSQGLDSLGFLAPGEAVMVPPVPPEAVRQVNGAIDVLAAQRFRAGQPAPTPEARAALVTLYNLGAIRGEHYSASCEARVQAQQAPRAGDANSEGAVNRSRWRSVVWSCQRNSQLVPQNRAALVALACLGWQMWASVEYMLNSSVKMTDPNAPRWLIALQMGSLPMGIIPGLIWLYLHLNKETVDNRRMGGQQQMPPSAAGPNNV